VSDRAGKALIDALRAALEKHPKVEAWQITHARQSGLQTYLVKTETETVRRTDGETFNAVLFVKNGDRLGRSSLSATPADLPNIAKRVDDCVFMAGLGGDAPWTLPATATAAAPSLETFDRALDGDAAAATARTLTEAWRAAIRAEQGATPSSMELFCASTRTAFENSTGLRAETTHTRVSLLTAVIAKRGERANESVSFEERRRAADLDVARIVRDAADEARDLTQATLTPSGAVPVLIDARDMAALFSPLQTNASGQTLYLKSSRFEVGKPVPMEGAGGEPLTVVSNALVPYGLSSYAFDPDGVPGQRAEIVKDGVFVRPWATKQFADYIGVAPTGAFANLEIIPGKKSFADLTAGDGPVLHVRNFSWLTPDTARGDFSSEIRVGYLYENGKRRPVKGGSVSGNLFRSLGSAHYASDRVFLGDYLGPSAIRLEGLSVVGT
jgi:predicted Zn-dependent protease